jgi:predicted nucleotidyltransferase component of viral defense system
MTINLPASILARLLILAKKQNNDYSLLLNRFAIERLLCRLSLSTHADRFLLKGALLFALWYDEPHRPTRDADLLGFGSDDANELITTIRDLAVMDLGDGIVFDPQSVRADDIRQDNTYGGTRINLAAHIGSARCALQIDVGFGDAVTPEATKVVFPTLLHDFQAPMLRVYPVYSVVAEKYHAMVLLGQANSRMKDFYDLAVIARRIDLMGGILTQAINATFARRNTTLPKDTPFALSKLLSEDEIKLRQSKAFLTKNRLALDPLEKIVVLLNRLLWPPTKSAITGVLMLKNWSASKQKWM